MKNRKVSAYLVFVVVCLSLVLMLASSGYTFILAVQCTLLLTLYALIITKIFKTLGQRVFLDDYRFYMFSFLFLYCFVVPLYGVITDAGANGIRVMNILAAGQYTVHELINTTWMSILLFLGAYIAMIIKPYKHKKCVQQEYLSIYSEDKIINAKKARLWLLIAMISTVVYLIPFLRGGFSIIASGGNILNVKEAFGNSNEGLLNSILSFFFGSEIMMMSTIAYVYYLDKSDEQNRSKYIKISILVAFHLWLIFATSRRAYSFMVILCCAIILITRYLSKRKKLPVFLFVITFAIVVVVYFAEGTLQSGSSITKMSLAEILFTFDGFGPYEVLLRASRETPDIEMLSNIVYGAFRGILFFGKYIIELLGINPTKPPLYLWMASRYSVYAVGGGLACLPQIESYLSLGYIGCFISGFGLGFVFSKERNDLLNYFLIAFAATYARGSWQIILSSFWSCLFVCYYVYECVIVEAITNGRIRIGYRGMSHAQK